MLILFQCCLLEKVVQLSIKHWTSQGGASGKEPTCQCKRHEMGVGSLGQEDPLEKGMATHSSILAWRIPQMEEPGGLQSVGLQRLDMTEAT